MTAKKAEEDHLTKETESKVKCIAEGEGSLLYYKK